MMQEVHLERYFMGRLEHGADLMDALNQTCQRLQIGLGKVSAIGAVQRAVLGYYDQGQQVYQTISLNQHMEIVQLTGNISIKGDKPFVHAHVTLSDATGRTYGGHVFPGTIVFACECVIQAFRGPVLQRALDTTTGLPLWHMQ
ncbi:MAG: DNA-binding protein [Magnetococcales bacterium]|nr:DNA-binding protein [Magnetococcales bacterium]